MIFLPAGYVQIRDIYDADKWELKYIKLTSSGARDGFGTCVVTDYFVEKTLTPWAYKMVHACVNEGYVEKATAECPGGWVNVSKSVYFSRFVDGLTFFKIRPRHTGIDLLPIVGTIPVPMEEEDFYARATQPNGQPFPKVEDLKVKVKELRTAKKVGWFEFSGGAAAVKTVELEENGVAVKVVQLDESGGTVKQVGSDEKGGAAKAVLLNENAGAAKQVELDENAGAAKQVELDEYELAQPQKPIQYPSTKQYGCGIENTCSAAFEIPDMQEKAKELWQALEDSNPLDAKYESALLNQTKTTLKWKKNKWKELALFEPANFDLKGKEQLSASKLVVVSLKSAKCLHIVAFYNGMLFESSHPFALAITRANLDTICGGKNAFQGFRWAHHFYPKDFQPTRVHL